MLNLLLAPIKTYFSLFTALALPHYITLFSSQTYSTRRSVAGEVARSLLRNRIKITTSEQLEGVLALLKVLIKEGIQQPSGYPGLGTRQRGGETDETLEEQGWLARIIHLVQAPGSDTQLQVSNVSLVFSSYAHIFEAPSTITKSI
jgi:vacuolar protein sorting-associated protein 35